MRARALLWAPLAVVAAPFLIGPALLGLASTFTSYAPGQPALRLVGLANYQAVLRDAEFLAALRNLALLVAASVPLELGLGLLLAGLLREPFPGRGLVRVVLLVPWMISPVASGVMWHYLASSTVGLLAFGPAWVGLPARPSPFALPGLALAAVVAVEVWRKAPLAGFLLLPGLLAVPAEHWEQATLEGAGPARVLAGAALPRLRPLLLAVGLLLAGDAVGSFETVLVLTGGGPGVATITPALYSFDKAFRVQAWPIGVAAAWLLAALVLLVGAGYLGALGRLRRG
jgi:ABC-type sugar transport system permease subunit